MTRDETSTSVQTHLTILQGVIERMASNSKSLKAWCITIVAAILVVVAGKDKPDYVLIALIPIVMFCWREGSGKHTRALCVNCMMEP